MKLTKLWIVAALLMVVGSASAKINYNFLKDKSHKNGVYMLGVSASFTDSLVLMTDIQHLADVALDKKGFLGNRAAYSLQLKDYLETTTHLRNRTCFIFYSENKKSLEKRLSKLKSKYQKNKKVKLQMVDPAFTFKKAETSE